MCKGIIYIYIVRYVTFVSRIQLHRSLEAEALSNGRNKFPLKALQN